MSFITMAWEWLHSQPSLARFAIGMAIIVGIPPLSRRVGIPAVKLGFDRGKFAFNCFNAVSEFLIEHSFLVPNNRVGFR